jgi:hypothetical protein
MGTDGFANAAALSSHPWPKPHPKEETRKVRNHSQPDIPPLPPKHPQERQPENAKIYKMQPAKAAAVHLR